MSNDLLAGLTVLTIINLKYSEDEYICVTHAGPTSNGKYLGWITTLEGRPVVNSDPIFDTAGEAEKHMRKVVEAAREWVNPGVNEKSS